MYLREQLTNNNKKANKTIIVSAPVRVSNKRPTGHDGHLSTIAAFQAAFRRLNPDLRLS